MPLIVFVSPSNVTPSGKPLTLFVTAWPLLSVASIVMALCQDKIVNFSKKIITHSSSMLKHNKTAL